MSLRGPIISIEDDEDDQYLIGRIIEALNVPNEVRFFSNGQEALHYLEVTSEQPFLILCDVNMPIMNGLELRKRMNKSEYLRRKCIPFVFLTTAANRELVDLAYDETVQGFFKKSTDYAKFQEHISLIINYWQNCIHPNSQF